jgi:hypothetical protein
MSNGIPSIPNNWNLTDEQKVSMKNAQQMLYLIIIIKK